MFEQQDQLNFHLSHEVNAATSRSSSAFNVIHNVSLILVERRGMTNMHDLIGRTFLAVARTNADVLLISQSSAEGNVCFVVPREAAFRVSDAIHAELALEIERRHVIAIRTIDEVAILSSPVNCSSIRIDHYDQLAEARINILACTRGATSVSTVIAAADTNRAIAALSPATDSAPRRALSRSDIPS